MPGERVRKMEVKANEAFDVYRELYYEGGVSSVYFWNLDDGFAGVVLLKKGTFSPPLPSSLLARPNRALLTGLFSPSIPQRRQQQRRRLGLDPRLRGERARAHEQLPTHLDRHPQPCDQGRYAGRVGPERQHDAPGGHGHAGRER